METKFNLELKYFCDDFVGVRRVLREIGAGKIIVKRQKDYFFNLPKNKDLKILPRLKLRAEGERQTLIFYQRANFSKTGDTPVNIILLPVEDVKILSFLTDVLGIRVIVEKTRELWKKENTVFHLDKVRNIGGIFEIEVWSSQKTETKDRAKFSEYRKKLLPHLGKIVKGSNEDLVLKLKRKNDL